MCARPPNKPSVFAPYTTILNTCHGYYAESGNGTWVSIVPRQVARRVVTAGGISSGFRFEGLKWERRRRSLGDGGSIGERRTESKVRIVCRYPPDRDWDSGTLGPQKRDSMIFEGSRRSPSWKYDVLAEGIFRASPYNVLWSIGRRGHRMGQGHNLVELPPKKF